MHTKYPITDECVCKIKNNKTSGLKLFINNNYK